MATVAQNGTIGPGTTAVPDSQMSWDDATWIMTASFIIFTMQSGFGLLESGCVSLKNEVNIMVKNAVDVILGGLSYWVFGYGLSFGTDYTNIFFATGNFLVASSEEEMGPLFATYIFQLSFATTATTIVSGAIAERFNFNAYCLFSLLNTVVYCLPAGWLWGEHGFLYRLGAIDIAGSGGVHLLGGVSGLVACIMVGPRLGRYDHGTDPYPMGCPTNAMLGMFMLWWGWLGFNCGSTFGVRGNKWKYAARSAVTTINASLGAGLVGMVYSFSVNRKLLIGDLINSVLGGLVSVTAGCALFKTWEAVVVGMLGGLFPLLVMPLLDRFHIDDPVGAVAVHGTGGFWGIICIGLFVEADGLDRLTSGNSGLFRGGGWYLLGIQLLTCVVIMVWSASTTFLLLFVINKVIPIRMDPHEELLGADLVEHGIRHRGLGVSRTVSALRRHSGTDERLRNIALPPESGSNFGHIKFIQQLQDRIAKKNNAVSDYNLVHLSRARDFGLRGESRNKQHSEHAPNSFMTPVSRTTATRPSSKNNDNGDITWINFDDPEYHMNV